jgi:rRNA maturation protein Nop10
MADDHPLTVFVAETAEVADAVSRLLASEGIAAETVSPPPQTVSDPLTGTTQLLPPDGLQVRVADAGAAARAKEVLGSELAAAAVRAVRERRAGRTGTVTAECEECGKPSDWPAAAMGTTEVCPHCGAYMDVPDPDDDWSGVDTGAGGGEDEEGEPGEGEE